MRKMLHVKTLSHFMKVRKYVFVKMSFIAEGKFGYCCNCVISVGIYRCAFNIRQSSVNAMLIL